MFKLAKKQALCNHRLWLLKYSACNAEGLVILSCSPLRLVQSFAWLHNDELSQFGLLVLCGARKVLFAGELLDSPDGASVDDFLLLQHSGFAFVRQLQRCLKSQLGKAAWYGTGLQKKWVKPNLQQSTGNRQMVSLQRVKVLQPAQSGKRFCSCTQDGILNLSQAACNR